MSGSSDNDGDRLTAIKLQVNSWDIFRGCLEVATIALTTLGSTRVNLANLTRNLDRLSRADAVVADSYVRNVLNKSGLCALAGLVALLGLAALALSAFWLLERSWGPVAASALIGILICTFAAVLFVFAVRLKPGREFSFALDVRRSAIEALEEDLASGTGTGSGTLLYPGSEALISAVAVPLMASDGITSSHAQVVEGRQDRATGSPEVSWASARTQGILLMVRIAIVVGHARRDTFCEQLGRAYQQGAKDAGNAAELFVTSKMSFDPILHEGFSNIQPLEPDLAAAHDLIMAADHLVLIFPLWLGTLPAIFKGFLECVFRPELVARHDRRCHQRKAAALASRRCSVRPVGELKKAKDTRYSQFG